MKLKTLLTQLLKRDTHSDEESLTPPQLHSEESRNVSDSEKRQEETEPGADGTAEEDLDLEPEDDQEADRDGQPDTPPSRLTGKLSRILSFIFPAPSSEEEIQSYIPHYRHTPIISGIIIPFAILLEIPGLTERWYIHTVGGTVVSSKPNPTLLVVALALSMICAVLANTCLIMRFLERRIMMMTILCIAFLSLHDILNVVALATFDVSKGNYTYGQSFWMTLCSTLASSFTNITLIYDFVRTSDFKRSGSGLTRRQRSLVIIIIGLFCYIGLGALINSLLLDLSFINGLYFTVVTIETIGFGDIVPHTPGSRVFICFYATLGIITLAFVVGYFREAVLEGIDFGYRRRILAIQEKRRAARRRRRAENRWRHAIVWRLRARNAHVWIREKGSSDHQTFWSKFRFHFWRFMWKIRSRAWRRTHATHCWHGMILNLKALPHSDLEAAALESGVPLDTLLPPDFYESYDQDSSSQESDVDRSFPWWFVPHLVYHHDTLVHEPLTHRRLGSLAALLTKFALAVYDSGSDTHQASQPFDAEQTSTITRPDMLTPSSSGTLPSISIDDAEGDFRKAIAETETNAYFIRVTLSSAWFLTFWMGGAAIFMATEGWTYGVSVYFCFIAFTTIGYGDYAPTTPAGRSIFVVWALVGVATMTIFISVVADAFTSRYKDILGRTSFKKAVREYRERTRADLTEKSQELTNMTTVRFQSQDIVHPVSEVTEGEKQSTSGTVDETSAVDGLELHRAHSQAQTALEQLPVHILTEARSIQQYMQLIGDCDGHLTAVEKSVEETIWSLMDDIVQSKNLSECTRADILKDDEMRRTLMLLGMEKSIQEIVSIAEQAVAAVQERDRIIAALEQERERDDEEGSSE